MTLHGTLITLGLTWVQLLCRYHIKWIFGDFLLRIPLLYRYSCQGEAFQRAVSAADCCVRDVTNGPSVRLLTCKLVISGWDVLHIWFTQWVDNYLSDSAVRWRLFLSCRMLIIVSDGNSSSCVRIIRIPCVSESNKRTEPHKLWHWTLINYYGCLPKNYAGITLSRMNFIIT